MMEYFAIINGVQSGPFPKDRLTTAGVQPDTFVWRQGLPGWVQAETLPELSDIFMSDSAFGGYARPAEPVSPYNVYGRQPEPVPHTNWLPWAIVGTVFGALFSCIGMIFGIIGITNAQKANKYYAEGFQQNGDTSNSSARTMTIIALVLGGVGFLLTVTGATRGMLNYLMNLAN